MDKKQLAAIGNTIVNALAAAGAAARIFRRQPRESPAERACNEMRRIREMATRQGWGPNPDWWPRPWRDRFHKLSDFIDRYHERP